MLINFKMQQQTELPLKKDKANFFLQISTGVSVFLFSMVLAAYFMTSSVIASWNRAIIDGMTVQIMPSTQAVSPDEEKVRIGKVIHFFENLDGVEKVALVKEKQIKRLMAPWLGVNADIEALPLPKLLNVQTISPAHITPLPKNRRDET